MIWGALIGVGVGLAIGVILGGKEKIVLLGSIGFLAGSGIGYGGKKFIMS